MTHTLILGGARSGKRRRALQLARPHASDVVLIATAPPDDGSRPTRSAGRREERPSDWTTMEAGTALGAAVASAGAAGCIVVDCLTPWLADLVCTAPPETLEREVDALLDAIGETPGDLVLVADEPDPDVVADDALARRFNDAAGALHRRLAQRCDRVEWTVAGLAVVLKPVARRQDA